MPVSIVVGGQFGSEGKGKTALEVVRRSQEEVVTMRVGGPDTEHISYDGASNQHTFRQLSASCIDKDVDVVFPAGSFIDVAVLLEEIRLLGLDPERVSVSPHAHVITSRHREWEHAAGIVGTLGSAGSGVGAAVMASAARGAQNFPLRRVLAADEPKLARFVSDVGARLRRHLEDGNRVVIEGSQGFGLSILEGGHWPHATARCTTAAGALAEAGLSPLDVDDITMVIRSYPAREAGDTGPLVGETTWKAIDEQAGHRHVPREVTISNGLVRRVGRFDAELVKRALAVNRPTRLVLNHLDYVGRERDLNHPKGRLRKFIHTIERDIGRQVDWLGFSGSSIVDRPAWTA